MSTGRILSGSIIREFVRACASNRILLNLIDGVEWPGPNMRTFEQPACRAFSLVTRTPAILELFTEGESVECFASVDEARDKIRFYLANESAWQREHLMPWLTAAIPTSAAPSNSWSGPSKIWKDEVVTHLDQ